MNDKQLAEYLHLKFCLYNHADYCGWFYEIKDSVHDWNGHAHLSWLSHAKDVRETLEED